jgi:hypothetical protein
VTGIQSKSIVIDTSTIHSVMGVVFRRAAPPFSTRLRMSFPSRGHPRPGVGSGVTALRDRLQEASTPPARFRVLETALLGRLRKLREIHPAVQHGLRNFSSLRTCERFWT